MKKTSLFIALVLIHLIRSNLLALQQISVHELIKINPTIKYLKVHDAYNLSFIPFPLATEQRAQQIPVHPITTQDNISYAQPRIPETFVLHIPQGKVYSYYGLVIANNCFITELLWQWSPLRKNPLVKAVNNVDVSAIPNAQKINGTVLVLAQEGFTNYTHWLLEVLPKFALIEKHNIQYDWIFVPRQAWYGKDLPFINQTLALFGIDPKKILHVTQNTCIEADMLIVPSAVSQSCITPKWVADYLRSKLIKSSSFNADIACSINLRSYLPTSEKVFISRKKASYRRIVNEDDIFGLLEPLGFRRYNLEKLDLVEQINLFKNAHVIFSAHGSGLANLIFASQGTKVIELFQEHEDDSYWYLSQTMGLEHHCIKTTDFKPNGGYNDTIVPIELVKKVIQEFL